MFINMHQVINIMFILYKVRLQRVSNRIVGHNTILYLTTLPLLASLFVPVSPT